MEVVGSGKKRCLTDWPERRNPDISIDDWDARGWRKTMKKILRLYGAALLDPAALLVLALAILIPAQAQADATIFLYSDPRPGLFELEGESALTEDFNQAVLQIPDGWTLDCVQNSGDIDPISTGQVPYYHTLDDAYADSTLDDLPHFMCVGNHEAETTQDMLEARAKFSGYPDWNLIAGPDYTSETTYSYDVGDIHVVVVNEYWDGASDDTWFRYGGGNGGYIPDALFEWIKHDLRSSAKPYKIIVGHEPGYPVGRHVGDSLDQDPENRDKFFNLMRTERVIAYFTAHTHRYYLTQRHGIFEVNTGACGDMVGNGNSDNFATLGYAHCDSDGFKVRTVREDPSLGWNSARVATVTRSDLETQILVNTADGAGTVSRYFLDYTPIAQPDNPDWSAYGAWWENAFDDVGAGWNDGELGVGYNSTNSDQWEWINQTIEPDPTNAGDEQVYGVFVRIPFTVHDKNVYRFMRLGVDYDDAITVWLNGTKIYESPTSPMISSTDYWDKVATDNHPASGDESVNPDFQIIDVSAYMDSLSEGSNLLVIGNWNWAPGSSDLVAGVTLYLTKGVEPDIKANGSDGPISITTEDNLSITIELDPGNYPGVPADWWVVADAPFGWYHYDNTTRKWLPGFQVSYQGPLFALTPPVEVLDVLNLPTGNYAFYFGVDGNRNGTLDWPLYYDSVGVEITP
jgi:hypothetical protein